MAFNRSEGEPARESRELIEDSVKERPFRAAFGQLSRQALAPVCETISSP